jgi:hypothetical protein
MNEAENRAASSAPARHAAGGVAARLAGQNKCLYIK